MVLGQRVDVWFGRRQYLSSAAAVARIQENVGKAHTHLQRGAVRLACLPALKRERVADKACGLDVIAELRMGVAETSQGVGNRWLAATLAERERLRVDRDGLVRLPIGDQRPCQNR